MQGRPRSAATHQRVRGGVSKNFSDPLDGLFMLGVLSNLVTSVANHEGHVFAHDNNPPTSARDSIHEALALLEAAIYEYDPATGEMRWLDIALAMALFGEETPDQLTNGEAFARMLQQDVRDRRDRVLASGPDRTRNLRIEYSAQGSDGRLRWLQETGRWIDAPSPIFVGAIRDIREQKKREHRYSLMALRDELTGLMPRDRLCEATELAVTTALRANEPVAFVSFAIDDLGVLNARFGVDVADQLIAVTASRLARAARANDLLGRTAGNKFGLLMLNCPTDRVARSIQRLRQSVCGEVIETVSGPIQVSVSAGVAVGDDQSMSGRALMAQAEASLDAAKRTGPGELHIARHDAADVSERTIVAQHSSSMLSALREDRVELQFQPIVDATTHTISRYECLARMRDASGVLGTGAEFVPAIESSGLVRQLDQRVLELSTDVLEQYPDVKLSVNVSGATVRQVDAAEAYLTVLEAIPRAMVSRLYVELTETCVVDARDRAVMFARRVRETGAKFSVDDFGAGYTSFRHLKALLPDEVKIDGAYANGVARSPSDLSFVQALVHLARALGMEVVAEWVGEEADAIALAGAGVHCLQGRMFGLAGDLPPRSTAA